MALSQIVFNLLRPLRVITAPEFRSKDPHFRVMVPKFSQLFAVPLYELGEQNRIELAGFYAFCGSAPFIVTRLVSEASLRLSGGSSDDSTRESSQLAQSVLTRLFGVEGAGWLNAAVQSEVHSSEGDAEEVATRIKDARTLSRADFSELGEVTALTNLAVAARAAEELMDIDPSIKAEPRWMQLFRGGHWMYTGQHLRKGFEPWLTAHRVTGEVARLFDSR